jgi:hypothetical protein
MGAPNQYDIRINLRRIEPFALLGYYRIDDFKEFTMSKFAIGEKVDNAADDHEGGTVIAVFPTVEGNFRSAVDMEGYGALQFFNEEKLVVHPC